jgi:hypothetical protein
VLVGRVVEADRLGGARTSCHGAPSVAETGRRSRRWYRANRRRRGDEAPASGFAESRTWRPSPPS